MSTLRAARKRALGFESLENRRLLASLPLIVDNSSPSFTKTGVWATYGPAGYGGTVDYPAAPYVGNDTATWSFDVLPGTYRIAVTWHTGYPTYGSNVPLTVLDGTTAIGNASLNQLLSPNDFYEQGAWWEDIGMFAVGSSLKVRMTDNANGLVIADAIRVERIENASYPSFVDNASSAFSKTGVWANYGPAGYAGTVAYPAAPYNGSETATWSFDVLPGTYRIAATWHTGYYLYGSAVPIRVYDGWREVGIASLNQKLSPNDFISQNTWWENIGIFTISNSLRIEMTDNTDGMAIADAIRIERVSTGVVPVAGDDSYFTSIATDLVVASSGNAHLLTNDRQPDGSPLRAIVQSQPAHGTLLSFDSKGGFTYSPNPGFVGVDTFTYQAQAANLEKSSSTKVSIAVGTPLLPRKNLDGNLLNTSMPDPWLQMSLLEPAAPSSGFDPSYANVPNGSSAETDGALAASGGLLLMENVAQDTMLTYRSDALTKPIMAAETQLAPGLPLPTAITASLTFNGVAGSLNSYPTAGLVAGQALRIAIQADGSALPTGMYDYTITINLTVNGVPVTQSFSGKQAIVNRAASEFGKGWGLDGLDRLYEQSTGALIVRGNGDSYWFPLVGGKFAHADGDISYSRLEKLANNTFRLTSKYGIVSSFSTIGLLTSKVDANANAVIYTYTSADSDGVADEIVIIIDPLGRVISFGYTASQVTNINHYSGRQTTLMLTTGNLTSYTLTDPDGAGLQPASSTSFTYTATQLVRTNALNESVTYQFDATDGRLRKVTSADNSEWRIEPSDTVGLPTGPSNNPLADAVAVVTDQRSKVWKFRTDRFGGITQSETPLGHTREYLRNKDGLVQTFIEPDPDDAGSEIAPVTYLGYNSTADVTFNRAADGGDTRMAYSFDFHRPLRIVNPVGEAQNYVYDNRGNMIASIDGAGFATNILVNSRGQVTRITDPDPDDFGPLSAPASNFLYNASGQLTSIYHPDFSSQHFTYNLDNQIQTVFDELSKITSFSYDALGRVISTINRVNATAQWQYDILSRVTKESDAMGNTTDFVYTNRGWIDTITYPDPDGSGPLPRPVSDTDYDLNGNVLFESDPRGNFTGRVPYTYDDDNRIKTIGSAVIGVDSRSVETIEYDNLGRLKSIARVPYVADVVPPQDPYPVPTDELFMRFDSRGRIKERISRQLPNAGGDVWFHESFEYDLAGRLIKTIDGNGNESINQYDGRGLLVRESLPDPDGNGSQFPLVITHQYDNMGRLTATDRGFGRVTRYEYNNRSWLNKITQPDPDGASGPATSPITLVGYDVRGDQTSITDAMNRTTTFSYDNEQRLLFQNDPDPDGAGPLAAAITGWGYNANNQVTYINEASAGITSSFQYDALGRLKSTVEADPDGTGPLTSPTTTYVYDAQGLQSIVDPLSHVTSYVRDARGRIEEMTDTAGSLTSYKYDFYDNLRLVTAADPDGAGPMDSPVTEFDYDSYGRLKAKDELATDALNASRHALTQYTYDAASNLTSLTDPNSNTTFYAYDNLNRVVSDTNALGKQRKYTYDVAGNMTRSVDRNGRVIEYEYDKLDRQTQERWQSYNYIPSVTAETLEDGHKVNETQVVGWTVPNSATNLTGTFTLTVGSSTTAPIDWAADAVTVQAALAALPNIGLGNVSVMESDPFDFSRSFTLVFRGARAGQDMPQTTINVSNFTTVPANLYISTSAQTTIQGSLVAEKQKIALSNGPGTTAGVWYLSYAGQVSNPLSPLATAQQVATELNQFAGIDNASVSTSYGYYEITFGGTQVSDNMQQIMADVSGLYKTSSIIRRIETQINAVGELTSVTGTDLVNNKSRSLSYVRDNLGRATNINSTYDAWNIPTVSLVQKFDAEGNRSELSATYGGYTDFKNNYTYDKLHRLTEVTQVGQAGATWITPKRVTQTFNALGQRTGIERFESITTANPVANTVFSYDTANRLSGIAHKQGTTNLDTYSYTYDPLSRLKTVTSTAEGLTTYGYDSQSQLTSADHVNYPDESFGYDANGNRSAASGYTTEDDNRTKAGPGWTYDYDDEGNMTQANDGQTHWYYTWDHRNRLVDVASTPYTATSTIHYEYDVFNRLHSREDGPGFGSSKIFWIYDEGINPVVQFDTVNKRKLYLWSDAVDDLLAAEDSPPPNGSANVLWPLSDHLGTIRDIADRNSASGVTSVVNHRRYDSFGQRVSETNAAVDLIFGNTGKLYDEATGLQNSLNRWYDPKLGKFVSQDPIGFAAGDANLYRYVGNRATSHIDPLGLADEVPDEIQGGTPIDMNGTTVPFPDLDARGVENFDLKWRLYWEGFSSQQRTSTFRRGCMDLAGKRLGSFLMGKDGKPVDPDLVHGSFPHQGDGVRMFSTLADAFRYANSLLQQGKSVRIFAAQNSNPHHPMPSGFKPSLPGEVSPEQVNTGGHYNFATLWWDARAQRWYWEWVNDGHSNQLRHTGGLPSLNPAGTNPPYYALYGVVEITDTRRKLSLGLPTVPWNDNYPDPGFNPNYLECNYWAP